MRKLLRYLTAALALLCLAEITDLAWLSAVRATITTTASKVVAAGNGSTTQWNFSFVGVSTADLIVSITNSSGVTTILTLNSQYSVTFTPQTPNSVWSVGGFVTYPLTGSPLAVGNTLTIQRQVPYTQTTPFQNQGQFLPQAVETAVDLLTMQAQQLNTLFTGALVEPATDSQPLAPLPAAAARANLALCFDSTGYNPIACATPASGIISSAMQPVVDAPSLAAGRAAFGLRSKLLVPTVFFVDNAGNDSNTCLAAGAPNACRTIQGALNIIYSSYDANGQAVAISCASSQVFTDPINMYGPILNPSFPSPITLNCNNSTINVTGSNAIQVGQGAYLQLINTVLKTTTSGNCLEAYQNGQIFVSLGVVFNGCAGFDMEAFAQGYLNMVGSYGIAAGSGAHCHLTTGSVFNAASITITLSNTPAWSDWFCGLSQSSMQFFNVVFAGTGGTGQRYLVHKASSIDTGVDPTMVQPETFLPGSAVGVLDASSAYLPYKAPTALSCGTSPTVSPTATDWSGWVTVGSGSPTSCDILFNAAKTTAPNCNVTNDGQVALTNFKAISNNTGIATSFVAASGATLHWTCTPTGV